MVNGSEICGILHSDMPIVVESLSLEILIFIKRTIKIRIKLVIF